MKGISIPVSPLVNIPVTFHCYLLNVGAISCCLHEFYTRVTVLAILTWTTWNHLTGLHDVPALSDFFFQTTALSSSFIPLEWWTRTSSMVTLIPWQSCLLFMNFLSTLLCSVQLVAFWDRGINNLGNKSGLGLESMWRLFTPYGCTLVFRHGLRLSSRPMGRGRIWDLSPHCTLVEAWADVYLWMGNCLSPVSATFVFINYVCGICLLGNHYEV